MWHIGESLFQAVVFLGTSRRCWMRARQAGGPRNQLRFGASPDVPQQFVREPKVRAATRDDVAAIRAFRSFAPPGARYERRAGQVLRRAALLLEQHQLLNDQVVLLFEVGDDLVAVAVLDRDAPTVGHVASIGLDRRLHGAFVEGSETKLSRLVLSTCLEWLSDDGCVRATALVHVNHGRSQTLLQRLNFEFQSMADAEYELHAVTL